MNKVKVEVPLKTGLAFALKLEQEGVSGPAYYAALNAFLSSPTDHKCACGKALKFFQTHGKLCDECCAAYLEALDRKERGDADPVEEKMFRMGVVPKYRHCTFATWRGPVPDCDAVDDWIVKPNRDVVIWGAGTGVGKTHLATAMLYSVASSGRSCFWITAIELAQRIFDEERDPAHPTLTRFERAQVAVLDDWGREPGAAIFAKEKVQAALDHRHNHNRPTIVTTNMVLDQAEAYDARTRSRLRSGLVLNERSGPDERLA